MEKLTIGVLVTNIGTVHLNSTEHIKLPEPSFYYALAELANDDFIDLFIFSPNEWTDRQLFGYRLRDHQWKKEAVHWPDVIYDRCFYTTSKQKYLCDDILLRLKQKKNYRLINSSLPNKWVVYETLSLNKEISPYLPHTEPFTTISAIHKWLHLYEQGIVIKPASGMQGKAVLHIMKNKQMSGLIVKGRSIENKPIDLSFYHELNAYKWLYRFTRGRSFIIQPYYKLRTIDDCPFDIRVLMQKNGAGYWKHSGTAARIGEASSLTSNLHGGGAAAEAMFILSQRLGSTKAEHFLQKIHMISGQTVTALEHSFGRFGEIALDFGVTNEGEILLLECNSKPGRQAFIQSNAEDTLHVYKRPLEYANYLVFRKQQINR